MGKEWLAAELGWLVPENGIRGVPAPCIPPAGCAPKGDVDANGKSREENVAGASLSGVPMPVTLLVPLPVPLPTCPLKTNNSVAGPADAEDSHPREAGSVAAPNVAEDAGGKTVAAENTPPIGPRVVGAELEVDILLLVAGSCEPAKVGVKADNPVDESTEF